MQAGKFNVYFIILGTLSRSVTAVTNLAMDRAKRTPCVLWHFNRLHADTAYPPFSLPLCADFVLHPVKIQRTDSL